MLLMILLDMSTLNGPVTVALKSIPGIVVECVDVAVRNGLVDAAEDRLATDHMPCGIAGL